MIISYKVYRPNSLHFKDIQLCGEFDSIDELIKRYRMVENPRGWYIVPLSIKVEKE